MLKKCKHRILLWISGEPVSGSEIVGPAELSKSEDEDKTGGNSLPFPLFRPANFSSAFYFRVFPTI